MLSCLVFNTPFYHYSLAHQLKKFVGRALSTLRILEFPHVMLLNVAGKGRPFYLSCVLYFVIWLSLGGLECAMAEIWVPPSNGFATMTYYTLPLDYIASKPHELPSIGYHL